MGAVPCTTRYNEREETMSAKGYEVYVVIRDKDYPFPQSHDDGTPHEGGLLEPWEAGWFLVRSFEDDDGDRYELEVLPFAEELAASTETG